MIYIDANNYIKRIYHGGQDPYELFLNLVHSYAGNEIAVVCDTKTSRDARRAIYPDYKIGRQINEDPVFFGVYNNIIKIALHFSNIRVMEVVEGEADDYILDNAKDGDIVVSNDKDLWPLVGKEVKILIAGQTKVDAQMIELKFNYPNPELIYVHKALVGDTSDKIKGKKGFGKAAYNKLTIHELFYIKDRLQTNGTGMAYGNSFLDILAGDESVKLSWQLVNPIQYFAIQLEPIHTKLQDFLSANDINLLENM